MTAKKAFGKIHLWLGLASGLIVFVVALSGSVLVFEEELELLFRKKQLVVKEVLPQRKSMDELSAAALNAYPGKKIKNIQVYHRPNRSVLFTMGSTKEERWVVAVDPYTAQVLGALDYNKRFFTIMERLHRQLLMGKIGKAITGVSCLVFITLLISGLVIWWPKTRQAIRQRFKIKWKAKFKRVNWDFHAVFGFYSFLILLVIAATGLVWSYPWVNKMIFVLADGKPREKNIIPNNVAAYAGQGVYEKIITETNRYYTYKGDISLFIPEVDSLGISVFKNNAEVALSNISSAIYFDRNSGDILKARPYESETKGMKIRRLIYPIHTGSAYGWPTKIVAFIVSLFAASLPVTGTLIWIGRLKKTKRKRKPVLRQVIPVREQLEEVVG